MRCRTTARRGAVATAVLGMLVGLLAACSAPAPTDPDATSAVVQIVYPSAQFSARTLTDWKSLGDAIATIEIAGSREDRSLDALPAENAGTFQRIVDISVLSVFWERDSAHVPPARFSTSAWGWTQHGNEKRPIVARGEPRLETGHVYLVVLARYPTGWATLGDGAEVPFEDGVVGDGEWAGRDPSDRQPAIGRLLGKNPAQVAVIVDGVRPDPRSVQYGNLDPLARARRLGRAG